MIFRFCSSLESLYNLNNNSQAHAILCPDSFFSKLQPDFDVDRLRNNMLFTTNLHSLEFSCIDFVSFGKAQWQAFEIMVTCLPNLNQIILRLISFENLTDEHWHKLTQILTSAQCLQIIKTECSIFNDKSVEQILQIANGLSTQNVHFAFNNSTVNIEDKSDYASVLWHSSLALDIDSEQYLNSFNCEKIKRMCRVARSLYQLFNDDYAACMMQAGSRTHFIPLTADVISNKIFLHDQVGSELYDMLLCDDEQQFIDFILDLKVRSTSPVLLKM